jgi:hypothetical protein
MLAAEQRVIVEGEPEFREFVADDEEEEDEETYGIHHAYSPSEMRSLPKTNVKIQEALHVLLLSLFSQRAYRNDQFFSSFT